jgi:putative tryptophan/tyrosine transport system substrate-binding protein
MRRRDFIGLLGGVAAWPMVARAQQAKLPTIGFLAAGANGPNLWGTAFQQGLREAGYVEGQNVAIEYRGGPPGRDRMRELVTELIRRQVAVILTSNDGPALAAKRETSTIPIVFFNIGSDPVKLGLVASISRPGGNVTGVGFDNAQLAGKRLDLLCQLVPSAGTVAYLNGGPGLLSFEEESEVLRNAAASLGRQLIFVECLNPREIDACFTTLVQRGAGAVTVASIPAFGSIASRIVALAAQYNIPAVYPGRGFALRGGLMSYAGDPTDNVRIASSMVGQILNGAKPADLPVRRSSKFDLIINLKTAKALGLSVPPALLAFADEVIE